MWIYNKHIYDKLSELRKINRLSSSKMRFLLKTNQIILINHIERLPYDETTIQRIIILLFRNLVVQMFTEPMCYY